MKERGVPEELRILRALNNRKSFSDQEQTKYFNAEKGYEGECKFDDWLAPLLDGKIVLNDLLLDFNQTIFQIDSLLLTSEKIILFEVKNFEGDYYVEGDGWYSLKGKEINNPLHQLHRNTVLLRGLLRMIGLKIPIEPRLIFMNPEFQLYQTPLDPPIIFPSQLNRFKAEMKKERSYANNRMTKIAQHLLKLHLDKNPNARLPQYNYDELRKGISCPKCQQMYSELTKTTLVCDKCDGAEPYEPAVLKAIEDFQLLFPDKKITTNAIYEWCGMVVSVKKIRTSLNRNFNQIKFGPSTYYENKK
ncbi:nuclease-related domain-containing protein [Pseudalkalibacillus sp. Hm43]|uniref:nuclease-related domain-containing protein n=1 Tax=Pseudalkalibacillus sp. Hm43 TaxID=3450742 RepID=UPI003F4409A1